MAGSSHQEIAYLRVNGNI